MSTLCHVAQGGVNSEVAQRPWVAQRHAAAQKLGKGLQSMSESKPVAMWVRIAASIALGLCVIPVVGVALIYWRERVITNGPWMEWFITVWVWLFRYCWALRFEVAHIGANLSVARAEEI